MQSVDVAAGEGGLTEEVAVAVQLGHRELDRGVGAGPLFQREVHQQPLAHARQKIHLDLRGAERLAVDREQPHLATPGVSAVAFRADAELAELVPAPEPRAPERIFVVGPDTVDVDAATMDLVVGHHDVLQCFLSVPIDVVGDEFAPAGVAALGVDRAVAKFVLVLLLLEAEASASRAARVGDDPPVFLGRVLRRDPHLDRVLVCAVAGLGDQVVELLACLARGARTTLREDQAPRAHPLGTGLECQVHGRVYAALVEGGVARLFLEVVEGSEVLRVALAVFLHDAVAVGQFAARDARDRDLFARATAAGGYDGGPGLDGGEHLGADLNALGAALVQIARRSAHHTRLWWIAQTHLAGLGDHRVRRRGVLVRKEERCAPGLTGVVATAGAVEPRDGIDGGGKGRDLVTLGQARRHEVLHRTRDRGSG